MIGDHIADGEPPARAQDTVKLGERALLVGKGAERALAKRSVERAIGERQRLGIAGDEADPVAEAGCIGRGLRTANRLGRELDARCDAAVLATGENRGGAGAGSDVDQPLVRPQADQLKRASRRPLASRVKLTAKQPLDRGARVGDGTCLSYIWADSAFLTCSR